MRILRFGSSEKFQKDEAMKVKNRWKKIGRERKIIIKINEKEHERKEMRMIRFKLRKIKLMSNTIRCEIR